MNVEAYVYTDHIKLRGHLRSSGNFGSRVITREAELTCKDIPAELSAACEQLADQLIQAYLASLPNS